jgi:hypothetical protein
VVLVFKRQTVNAPRKGAGRQRTPPQGLDRASAGCRFPLRQDSYWTMQYHSANCRELTGYDPETLIDNCKLSYYDLIHSR